MCTPYVLFVPTLSSRPNRDSCRFSCQPLKQKSPALTSLTSDSAPKISLPSRLPTRTLRDAVTNLFSSPTCQLAMFRRPHFGEQPTGARSTLKFRAIPFVGAIQSVPPREYIRHIEQLPDTVWRTALNTVSYFNTALRGKHCARLSVPVMSPL